MAPTATLVSATVSHAGRRMPLDPLDLDEEPAKSKGTNAKTVNDAQPTSSDASSAHKATTARTMVVYDVLCCGKKCAVYQLLIIL